MKCKTCEYGSCTGTEVKTNREIYDCKHGNTLTYIGYSKDKCEKWEERDFKVIRIFGK
ncbi:hypothetical protein [Maledivibacter halophilus]|uniref:Uncharacterized protein n=1 Tax=Maledivibacter halophilus TaxID=36842 RepID=A0A1T5KEG7_9FIRM|nr:hypothetical protein [Maledivibacter halophilus]SKC62142.1 hypothetical protein SAMN02194393_01737 [Maledivibacter halophilus]